MYRYKCTAAENGSKQDFYDVTEQLKALYPELTENVGKRFDNEFLRREFVCGKNRVMVQYSFSEQSVTVYSKEWLGKYYGERQVLKGRFPLYGTAATGTMWAISGVYFAVMAFLTFIIAIIDFDIVYDIINNISFDDTKIGIVLILIMAAMYTSSGIIIRRRNDINLPKLIFCQAGGFVFVCAMLVLANLVILSFYLPYEWFDWAYLIALPLLMFALVFLTIFLPALEISFLLQGAVGLIMKKYTVQKQ